MKKIFCTLILILSIFLIVGCSQKDGDNTLEKVPTTAELMEFSKSHSQEEIDAKIKEVLLLVDKTSYEETCKILEDSIHKWIENQSILKVDEVAIDCSRDELLMVEGKNEKIFSNMFLDVEIYYDYEMIEGSEEEIFDSVSLELIRALNETPYGRFRINELDLLLRGENKLAGYSQTLGMTMDNIIAPAQPIEELNIQTRVYNFVEDFNKEVFNDQGEITRGQFPKEITLRRFGIKGDTGELYSELAIYSLGANQDVEEFKGKLVEKSKDLYDLIVEDKEAVKYLEDNKIKTVIIQIYTPWDIQRYHSYTYNL